MAEGSSPRTDRQEVKVATPVRTGRFLALFLVLGVPLLAQEPVGLGPSFVVNNPSAFPQGAPSVSRLQEGGFVVSWMSVDNGGATEFSIRARVFDQEGSPGEQFQVNSPTRDEEWNPDVEVLADGSFVVVWGGLTDVPAASIEVKGRRFSASGQPLGEEFTVNANTVGPQWYPKVVALDDGGFVVIWRDDGGDRLAGRRLDAVGQPLGLEFPVNNVPGCCSGVPTVASDEGAGFIVVWEQHMPDGPDDDGSSVQARLFAADVVPHGPQFRVNTYTTYSQRHAAVSLDASGGFVVVWTSHGSFGDDTSQSSVQAQRLTSDGVRVGGQFQVNSTTTGPQRYPSVGEDGAGGFVVAWSDGSETSSYRLRGQRFALDGQPTGQEFPVDTEKTGWQFRSRMDHLGAGRFVVAWPQGSDVRGRRFVVPLFADGFESGDTSAWTDTVP